MPPRPIQKTCSHCGGDAGRFIQFWNQDTGFGICPSCVTWLKSRGTTDEYLRETHGEPGVHYGTPEGTA